MTKYIISTKTQVPQRRPYKHPTPPQQTSDEKVDIFETRNEDSNGDTSDQDTLPDLIL